LTALTGLLFLNACSKTDNYDGPNASMKGQVIDKLTSKPFMTGQGEFSILHRRILQSSKTDRIIIQNSFRRLIRCSLMVGHFGQRRKSKVTSWGLMQSKTLR
jgi:hypothetical protein